MLRKTRRKLKFATTCDRTRVPRIPGKRRNHYTTRPYIYIYIYIYIYTIIKVYIYNICLYINILYNANTRYLIVIYFQFSEFGLLLSEPHSLHINEDATMQRTFLR